MLLLHIALKKLATDYINASASHRIKKLDGIQVSLEYECEAPIGSTTKNLEFEEIFNSFNVDMMKFISRKTLFMLSDRFLKNDFD